MITRAAITDPEVWLRSLAAADLPSMRARGDLGRAFRAGLRTGSLGPVRLAEFVTPGGECFRDDNGIRAADQALYQVYLVLDGRTRLAQAGREAEMGAGDLALIDPARPLDVTSTDVRYLTVLVPRHLLGVAAGDLDRLAGTRVPGDQGSGALLAALARTAIGSTGFGQEEAVRSGSAIAELITAVLSARLPCPSPDETLRAQVRTFVLTHLRDPGLGPASIAAAHHISVRRLHQLFRDEPLTVAATIRHHRLERCRTELAARPGLPVATVAARWGFTDPAHFSRLFRTTYGRTASDYRHSVSP